jgi:hypothetical protein
MNRRKETRLMRLIRREGETNKDNEKRAAFAKKRDAKSVGAA